MMGPTEAAMAPKDYLAAQATLHPGMRPQDMVKLCYQAVFGAEHLIKDEAAAKRLFDEEFASVSGSPSPLCEWLSPGCCRVNLSAWKQRGMPSAWLFQIFRHSAEKSAGSEDVFRSLLRDAGSLCAAGVLPFTVRAWDDALAAYWRTGGGAVHHSKAYKACEQPAYRVVGADFVRLFPLLESMARLDKPGTAQVVALDGRAASGKTTMAAQLSRILDVGVIHMDDFFLPLPLRSESRLQEPGGNVHYERFAQEVLPEIAQPEAFCYRRFDCCKMDFGDIRTVAAATWRIVEGAYSCHPRFGNYADIKVFCDVTPAEQMRRIKQRNGAEGARRFAERWIPLEERYLAHFQIAQKADVIL